MRFSRTSGILLHITSLPGQFGVGDLGDEATRFVDFLKSSGQSIWQVLPLSPPAFGESPYSSYSAFAGNELLISPHVMVRDGLIAADDIADGGHHGGHAADFEYARQVKLPLLRKAFENFQNRSTPEQQSEFRQFCDHNQVWLNDFARFVALKQHFGHSNWSEWDRPLVDREAVTLAHWDQELAGEIEYTKFVQFVFDSQWKRLKAYANANGIQIFGDMPIFVAYESADVWANQDLFFLDEQGKQTVVAGVPPDYFSETGQRWGNPLYRWDRIADTNYQWWTNRFRCAFENFDLVRIDHFRGFESYWEVQADCDTAIDGKWQPGPGAAPFLAAQEELGELPIIAEDLGMITDDVHDLRDDLGFPGMRVFQFGFDNENDPYHRPEAYPKNSAAYTGTHDNDTIMGWYDQRKSDRDEDPLLDAVVPPTDAPHWSMIRAVLGSEADLALVPMQDVLGLGTEFRMNTPGEASGNWGWRCSADAFYDGLSAELHEVTEATHRVANHAAEVAAY